MAGPATLPADALAPFEPSDKAPWTPALVGHLYRRAAFGGTYEQIVAGAKQSPEDLVDAMLDFDPEDDPFNKTLESLTGFVDLKDSRPQQSWWIHRALNTPHPIQEKMALFWHDHFATSVSKVGQAEFMHTQVEMFRRKGLGNFRDLLIAVGRDPAMLIWLDGRESKKGKPNENYAREVMELFTLGIGNYTEKDVKQLARCFTGWSIRDGEGQFNKGQFDDGEKEIFGQKGKFNDEQAIDVLLQQPAAAKWIARKLLFEFVHPQPDQTLIDATARVLLDNKWEIKPTLRTILLSRVFYSEYAYRSRIKSPAELSIGLALTMGGKIKTDFVREQMNRMGQQLLFPPNVKGWDGNETWINANTYIIRFNYGWALAQTRGQDYARRGSIERMLKDANAKTAEQVVDFFALALLDGRIPGETRSRLIEFIDRDEQEKPRKFEQAKGNTNRIVRSMLHVMTTLPEFQLA